MPSLGHVLCLIRDGCPAAPEGDVTAKNMETTCSFMSTKTDVKVYVMTNVDLMWLLGLEDRHPAMTTK